MQFHKVVDTQADGNCFYTSVVQACNNKHIQIEQLLDLNTLDEEEEEKDEKQKIQWLREFITDYLQHDPKLLLNLYGLIKSTPKIASQFPLTHGFDIENGESDEFVKYCISQIRRDQMWASEIEHTIVRNSFKNHDLDLLTISVNNIQDMLDYCDMEEDLLKMAQWSEHNYCMVLVNVSSNHYMYITLEDRGIIKNEHLVNHLQQYIDFCEANMEEPGND